MADFYVTLTHYFNVEADNPNQAVDRALAVQRGGRIEGVELLGGKEEVDGRNVTGQESDRDG